MKEEGRYYGLLEEIKEKIVEIEFKKWIKLYFKSSLDDKELNEKTGIEASNIKTINDIFGKVNVELINQKIKQMQDFEYITTIEKE